MPPSTPPPQPAQEAARASLWASPQFSDYFSDSGDADRHLVKEGGSSSSSNPVQAQILRRLDTIAKKIANQATDDGSQTRVEASIFNSNSFEESATRVSWNSELLTKSS